MNTLTITNEEGTVFNYSKDGEFLIVSVTKKGKTNEYKTYNKNQIKDGKLNVCRADGSWVKMPVCQAGDVQDFMKSRVKASFNSLAEWRAFEADNDVGQMFYENNVITAYKYL